MSQKSNAKQPPIHVRQVVEDILNTIERSREREIVAKRFGLFARRETLEQIGEVLQITRERVRQLEKSIIANLRYNPREKLPHIDVVEKAFTKLLKDLGNVARIQDLGAKLGEINDHVHQSQVLFLGHLSPKFVILKTDSLHYSGLALASSHPDHDDVKQHVADIVEHIAEMGEPVSATNIHFNMRRHSPQHVHALATLSKKLSHLNARWGLNHWPTVNPKNIRAKIYIVLRDARKPLHFSDIANLIQSGNFKRNQVTRQAVHNELIKDDRFILIGRGIYGLAEWGYKKGTVSDVIHSILKKAGEPMERDEIIKEVLKRRQVKHTTILLNLQCKPHFHRLKDGKYTLKE